MLRPLVDQFTDSDPGGEAEDRPAGAEGSGADPLEVLDAGIAAVSVPA
jgi:hypothetical protein